MAHYTDHNGEYVIPSPARTLLALTLCVFCSPIWALGDEVTAPVVGVLDGDTIEVLHNNCLDRVRLNGSDCPEKGQAYGIKSKQTTAELVFRKEVTLQTHGKDKYGRTIADMSLPNGIIVNLELVRNGWCWWYQKYAPDNAILAELQRRARRSGVALWADPHPIPPWEWRKPK